MGQPNKSFRADCVENDFDRGTQNKMFKQIPLKNWCIIYSSNSYKDVSMFKDALKKCLEKFGYDADPPKQYDIGRQDSDWRNWKKCIDANVNNTVKFVVFILPGQKGKGKCYSDIKKQFLENTPVPNQVVCQSTISKGRNLQSIVTKILIQINSKLGGIPWNISPMPFDDKPTMVVGISIFKKRG